MVQRLALLTNRSFHTCARGAISGAARILIQERRQRPVRIFMQALDRRLSLIAEVAAIRPFVGGWPPIQAQFLRQIEADDFRGWGELLT
jgi:hypothetical protein